MKLLRYARNLAESDEARSSLRANIGETFSRPEIRVEGRGGFSLEAIAVHQRAGRT